MLIPCVSKPSCTPGIIVSLWLICYIQHWFSISYLSIPGIVDHDRCNISHIFTFSFQFQCPLSCCVFHLYNCFSGGFIIIIISIHIIIFITVSFLALLLLWLLFFYTHNQYNYPNNYHIIISLKAIY